MQVIAKTLVRYRLLVRMLVSDTLLSYMHGTQRLMQPLSTSCFTDS